MDMARLDLSNVSLMQLVTCSVCKEVEDKLKILPCHQPVCLPCTCKISVNKHHRYTCPLCDKKHMRPNGGFKYLPDSLVSLKLSAWKQRKKETTAVAKTTGYQGKDVASDNEDNEQTSDGEVSDNMSGGKAAGTAENNQSKPLTPDDVDLSRLREEMDEQLQAGKRWQKRAEELTEAQREAFDQIPEVANNTREALTTYQQRLTFSCQRKLQGLSKGLEEQKAELENRMSSLQPFVDQMKDAVKRAPQLLKRLADDDCEAEDRAAAEQLLDKINGLNKAIALSELGKVEKLNSLSSGDSVRLNTKEADDDIDKLVHGKVDHSSVGVFVGICERTRRSGVYPRRRETALVVFPEHHDWEGTQISDITKSVTKANMPYVGDRVRIKGSVVTPHFSWNGVRAKKSRGILKKVDLDTSLPAGEMLVEVDFPEDKGWKGLYSEIELLPGCGFEVGDEVRVNSAIPEPSRGWAGVNGSSVGKVMRISGTKGQEELTINFPECKNWIAMATDLELIRKPTIGKKVQVKLTVKTPKHGWVGVNHEDVGELVRVDSDGFTGEVAQVQFPGKKNLWSCDFGELEPARYQIPDYGSEDDWEDEHAARMMHAMFRNMVTFPYR